MDPIKKQLYTSLARNAIISGLLTSVFMYLVYYPGWESLAAGMYIGSLIYLAIGYYSDRIADRYLRKVNLIVVLILNTTASLVIMLVIAWTGVGLFYVKGNFRLMLENINNVLGYHYLVGLGFGLLLSVVFNFLSIVNTLIGRKTLGKLFVGRYRNPLEVDHAFMFLDIRSSTAIAEKTGPTRFMSLVNDFFHDIALPVARARGEIYKYVGDGVIITWKMEDALKDANCLRCFAWIGDTIRSRAGHYEQKYGLVPEFRAGLHGGTVTTGELGYIRREIAYMGDVLNTAARIEEACKKFDADFLVSDRIMERLELPAGMLARDLGSEVLRGKSEKIRLMEVITVNDAK